MIMDIEKLNELIENRQVECSITAGNIETMIICREIELLKDLRKCLV